MAPKDLPHWVREYTMLPFEGFGSDLGSVFCTYPSKQLKAR